jgi:hypothetical protein
MHVKIVIHISMCAVSEILMFCARFEDLISVTVDISVMECPVVSKYRCPSEISVLICCINVTKRQ